MPTTNTRLVVIVAVLAVGFLTGFCTYINPSFLASWVRHPSTPIFGGTAGNFAGDPYVWKDSTGTYRMLYTSEYASKQAIGMATSSDLVTWTPVSSPQYGSEFVLRGAGPASGQDHQETAFYRLSATGQHQIYYIGYDSEVEYHAAIYRATASTITGPYTREATPVINFGANGTYDDSIMTSPTIVDHYGTLYMNYVAWDDLLTGAPNVINAGAISTDDGATWTKTGTIAWDNIFGVEGHIEEGPDGLYYRVAVESTPNDEIKAGWSAHPFGPYTTFDSVLTLGGAGVGEVDSITSPSLYFNTATRQVYMYYGAVDTGGFPWMTGLAIASY